MKGTDKTRAMISATVLTFNSQRHLAQVLKALQPLAEVIVLDCNSTDQTAEIARDFDNVSVHSTPVMGFGALHAKATKLAKCDWILSIDSDEVPSKALIDEILALELDEEAIYAFRRDNFFRGRRIWSCGWSPDWVVRLYNRKRAGFDDRLVHEKVCGPGLVKRYLRGKVAHEPFATAGDFLVKIKRYGELFAKQSEDGRSASLGTALGHGWWAFFRSYILRGGLLQGYEGYVISAFLGHMAYYKYLMLRDRVLNSQSPVK